MRVLARQAYADQLWQLQRQLLESGGSAAAGGEPAPPRPSATPNSSISGTASPHVGAEGAEADSVAKFVAQASSISGGVREEVARAMAEVGREGIAGEDAQGDAELLALSIEVAQLRKLEKVIRCARRAMHALAAALLILPPPARGATG